MTAPYFTDGTVNLYHGDFRELAPLVLTEEPDLVVADPPYGETSLDWDRWLDGWPSEAPGRSMWCFGSMRMFTAHAGEFRDGGWKLSQDVVGADEHPSDRVVTWEKHNGSGFAKDRFRRVHEYVTHWYRGAWRDVRHEVPRVPAPDGAQARSGKSAKARRVVHTGAIADKPWRDDGTRLARSVLAVRNMHARGAINESEKPVDLLAPLLTYSCPPGGLVVDLFAGSCSTLVAARDAGMRAIGFELREEQCERAAERLTDLFSTAMTDG